MHARVAFCVYTVLLRILAICSVEMLERLHKDSANSPNNYATCSINLPTCQSAQANASTAGCLLDLEDKQITTRSFPQLPMVRMPYADALAYTTGSQSSAAGPQGSNLIAVVPSHLSYPYIKPSIPGLGGKAFVG